MRLSTIAHITFVLLLGQGSLQAAGPRAKPIVYGEDDRLDIRDVQDRAIIELARSTAVMAPKSKLTKYMDEMSKGADLSSFSLQSEVNVCSGERFSSQPAFGDCTGFLVGEKTLVTAGHCVKNAAECDQNLWAFDYHLETSDANAPRILQENVYKCTKVVRAVLDISTRMDYSIIELDRSVEGRQPLKFRQEGSINTGENIFVIGHPSGLPTKVAAGARVMEADDRVFFKANLDTFGGNSGSPVFNAKTLEVEGILVRGAKDYLPSSEGCRITNIVAEDKATEAVTRITGVAELFGRTYVEEVPDNTPIEIPLMPLILEEIELPTIELEIDLPDFVYIPHTDDEDEEEQDEDEEPSRK